MSVHFKYYLRFLIFWIFINQLGLSQHMILWLVVLPHYSRPVRALRKIEEASHPKFTPLSSSNLLLLGQISSFRLTALGRTKAEIICAQHPGQVNSLFTWERRTVLRNLPSSPLSLPRLLYHLLGVLCLLETIPECFR